MVRAGLENYTKLQHDKDSSPSAGLRSNVAYSICIEGSTRPRSLAAMVSGRIATCSTTLSLLVGLLTILSFAAKAAPQKTHK